MLSAAERETGLTDWGGDAYFEADFRRLLEAMSYSLRHESNLTRQGRAGADLRLAALLEARLEFIDDRKRQTEITRQPITKPMFIVGLPRSGSTFLHTLMSQDPANRVPVTWEMMLPSPPARDDRDAGTRIARVEGILASMGLQTPEILALHPFGARLPEEDHLMTEIGLLGDNLPAVWRMPAYNKQRSATNNAVMFALHRMMLQTLQHGRRGERVLLKNPGHIFNLGPLFAEYPDALVVQTHRDPAKVIPSVAALIVMMRTNSSDDRPPPEKVAQGNVRAFADGLGKAIVFRQQPGMTQRFCDVHFRDLVTDPIRTVERVYTYFGLQLSRDAREAMQRWLADPAIPIADVEAALEALVKRGTLDVRRVPGSAAIYMNRRR